MNRIKIVCQTGISILYLSSLMTMNQMVKLILTTGEATKPKIAIKLAIKLGILNHLNSIFIKLNANAKLQIMANRAIKAKKDLLNRFPMVLN